MGKRLTPGQKAARTRAKNKKLREQEAARAARAAEKQKRADAKAERERKKAEREERRKPCAHCGKRHRSHAAMLQCGDKAAKLSCTCPPYWHKVRRRGERWLSHSQPHGCALAGEQNRAKALAYNVSMGYCDEDGVVIRQEPPLAPTPTATGGGRVRRSGRLLR